MNLTRTAGDTDGGAGRPTGARCARFGRAPAGYEGCMHTAWILLALPGTSVVLGGVLFLSAWIERRMLSPRRLILGAARARRNTPEFAEAFVAGQFERLLREESVR